MTTVDKTIKTLAWVAVSSALMAVASFVTQNQDLFSPLYIAGANIVLVFLKNFADPKVRNF